MLNFDPYRWIAERGPAEHRRSVATVATVARVRAEIEKSDLQETAATVATPATLPGRQSPSSILRDWHGRLVTIDDCLAPVGCSIPWWQQACDDARWDIRELREPRRAGRVERTRSVWRPSFTTWLGWLVRSTGRGTQPQDGR